MYRYHFTIDQLILIVWIRLIIELLYPICELRELRGALKTFRLTGLCPSAQAGMDIFYLMKNSFQFLGYLGLSSITFSPSEQTWSIKSLELGNTLAVKPGLDLPLGKQRWNFSVDNCEADSLKLHLDVEQPGHFCCDDGLCVQSEKVCDGIADCESFRKTFSRLITDNDLKTNMMVVYQYQWSFLFLID